MNFQNRIEGLVEDLEYRLSTLVLNHGTKSKFNNFKSIKIEDEDFQFNIEGSKYLCEVTQFHFISNEGLLFDFNSISLHELAKLADYLTETHI